MKKSGWCFCILCTLASVLLFIPIETAEADTLDLNGSIIDMEQSDGDIVLENGITMISENFLRDDLYLNVGKNGKQFSLKNNHDDFCIEGSVGENTLSFNEKSIALPVSVSERDGILYGVERRRAEHHCTLRLQRSDDIVGSRGCRNTSYL